MEERFSWIPFYSELAKALLAYKDDRKPLVDFVYSELSQVGGRSLVDYIHMRDGSKVKDIDPFSVFAIFNRPLRPENRVAILQKFKDRFALKSTLPCLPTSSSPTTDKCWKSDPPHFWAKIARDADVQGVSAMRGVCSIRHISPS